MFCGGGQRAGLRKLGVQRRRVQQGGLVNGEAWQVDRVGDQICLATIPTANHEAITREDHGNGPHSLNVTNQPLQDYHAGVKALRTM